MAGLYGLDYAGTLRLADTARDSPDPQVLIDLQFEQAHTTDQTDQADLQRHTQTRQWAVGTLLATIRIAILSSEERV